MKKLVKIFLCFVITLCSIFMVAYSNSNQEYVNASEEYTAIVDNDGNKVTYRNTNEAIMRLSEYNYPTQNLRAAWVSHFISSMPKYTTEAKFKQDYKNVLDNMESYGLNCIIFHVRTHNNALYKSELNPVATWFASVDFDTFDPLEWAIEETHKRGMEFHAWLNPYRISDSYCAEDYPEGNPANDSANILSTSSGKILNPGIQSNRDFIVDSCMEVVENYDVDAIHFDDYFYIDGVEDNKSGDWKRQQVDLFIEQLSNELREYSVKNDKIVQLGISPSGIYRNGSKTTSPTYDKNGNLSSPLGSNTSGFSHYDDYLYSDTLKWINEEWIDYIMPQTYWAIEHTAASYGELSKWWSWAVKNKKVNLYLGIGYYMAESTSGSGSYWQKNKNEIRDQILNAEMYDEIGGISFYSYNYLNSSNSTIKTGMTLLKNDYFSKKIPCDIKQYYAPLYDTVPVKNVKVINDVLIYDEAENVRGYIVYKVKKNTALNQNDINQVYYYGTDLSVQLDDTANYTYYISTVNLANEISEPFNTEAATATAQNVIEKINALPALIKLEHEGLLTSIKTVYDVLPAEEAAKVTNAQKLLDGFALLEAKKSSIDVAVSYKDLTLYTNTTQKAMNLLIRDIKVQIDNQTNIEDVKSVLKDFKAEMDKFLPRELELKNAIDAGKKILDDYYNALNFDYYYKEDLDELELIYEEAYETISNALSETEITKKVNNAIAAMSEIKDFKVEYEKVIAEIDANLQYIIDDKVESNPWYAKRGLDVKKAELIDEIRKETKQRVLVNPTFYSSIAENDLNDYIDSLSKIYGKIKAVTVTIKAHDNTVKGAQALIDEYVEKVELANSIEEVDELKAEFKDKYNALKKPQPTTSSCSMAFVNVLNMFSILGVAILAFRRRK